MSAVLAPDDAKPALYELSDAQYETFIRQSMVEVLLSPVEFSEKQQVRLRKDFDTACWTYRPPHAIFIGNKLFDKEYMVEGLSLEAQGRYVKLHYRHELAHAMFTERDFTTMNVRLKQLKIPFGLWNIFEDARIEPRFAKLSGLRFDWLNYEKLVLPQSPENLLLSCIQAAGDIERVRSFLHDKQVELALQGPCLDGKALGLPALEQLDTVASFYERAVAAQNCDELYPVMLDWLKTFPRMEQPSQGFAGAGELSEGAQLQLDGKLMEQWLQESSEVKASAGSASDNDGKDEGAGAPRQVQPSGKTIEGVKAKMLRNKPSAQSLADAETIASRMRKFFRAAVVKVSTLTPGRRISARHAAIGRAPYRRADLLGRKSKELEVFIDCSGSMGIAIHGGRVLVKALSQLAQEGLVKGHVTLSAIGRGGAPQCETFALPMQEFDIRRIHAFGSGEGLQNAIMQRLEHTKKADNVLVYTDAQITDEPIDKGLLHAHGIQTWGLYVGQADGYITQSLLTHFDKALVREDVVALADALLALNSKH